jgi:omega-amidase
MPVPFTGEPEYRPDMPRAHLVQLDIAWEDPGANHARVEQLLARAPVSEGDLVLLPEMFATGFSFNIPKVADSEGRTLEFLRRMAADRGVLVQGGRAAWDGSVARNVMSVWSPRETAVRCEYAKIHPFPTERDAYTSGETVTTYRWESVGLTVCPAICYDLRFPELFRFGLLRGAEAYALGACWPNVRQAHWRALLIARAIENQAFVLACNRVGTEPGVLGQTVHYAGGSIVVSPRGDVLGELGDEEGVLSVEIDPSLVRDWRRTFRAWRDIRLMTGPAEGIGGDQ